MITRNAKHATFKIAGTLKAGTYTHQIGNALGGLNNSDPAIFFNHHKKAHS